MFARIDVPQGEPYRPWRSAASPSALCTMHRVFVADGVYLIAVLLILDAALVLVRRHFGHMQGYYFIRWNLLLAMVPYWVSLCTSVLQRCVPRLRQLLLLRVLLLLPLYALWLLFLPNAPYLLTDFIHLEDKTTLQVWYDTIMLATYAVTGYALAIVSLAIMHRPVRALLGWRVGWLFTIVCCFLAGIGVHLGRAQRYNSWDALSRSKAVLADVLDRLVHLYDHPHTTSDGLYYGALLLVGYVAFLALSSTEIRAIILKGWEG